MYVYICIYIHTNLYEHISVPSDYHYYYYHIRGNFSFLCETYLVNYTYVLTKSLHLEMKFLKLKCFFLGDAMEFLLSLEKVSESFTFSSKFCKTCCRNNKVLFQPQ